MLPPELTDPASVVESEPAVSVDGAPLAVEAPASDPPPELTAMPVVPEEPLDPELDPEVASARDPSLSAATKLEQPAATSPRINADRHPPTIDRIH